MSRYSKIDVMQSAGEPPRGWYWFVLASMMALNGGLGAACWSVLKPTDDALIEAREDDSSQMRRSSGSRHARGRYHDAASYSVDAGPGPGVGPAVSRSEESDGGAREGVRIDGIVRALESLMRERARFSGRPGQSSGVHHDGNADAEPVSGEAYSLIRSVLEFEAVDPDDLPTPESIRQTYSHRRVFPVSGRDTGLSVVAKWMNYDVNGVTESHLYAMVEDEHGMLVTFHWFLCKDRDVSMVSEQCMPLVSMFVDSQNVMSIGYYRNGVPRTPPDVRGPADFSVWSDEHAGYVSAMQTLDVIADRGLAQDSE